MPRSYRCRCMHAISKYFIESSERMHLYTYTHTRARAVINGALPGRELVVSDRSIRCLTRVCLSVSMRGAITYVIAFRGHGIAGRLVSISRRIKDHRRRSSVSLISTSVRCPLKFGQLAKRRDHVKHPRARSLGTLLSSRAHVKWQEREREKEDKFKYFSFLSCCCCCIY